MNKITALVVSLTFAFLLSSATFAQETKAAKNPKYDKDMAKRLGADKYGMKQYIFVFLKRGKTKFEGKEREALLKGHMDTIGRLAKDGKLVLAGPFSHNQDVRGIYIFDVKTLEEAQKLVESDPSIKAGLFEVEMRPWYGSASLLEVLKVHEKIAEEEI